MNMSWVQRLFYATVFNQSTHAHAWAVILETLVTEISMKKAKGLLPTWWGHCGRGGWFHLAWHPEVTQAVILVFPTNLH